MAAAEKIEVLVFVEEGMLVAAASRTPNVDVLFVAQVGKADDGDRMVRAGLVDRKLWLSDREKQQLGVQQPIVLLGRFPADDAAVFLERFERAEASPDVNALGYTADEMLETTKETR